jgi:phytoene dehydrogenase-like protein
MGRRFRSLRTEPLPHYDAVIIGAGVGGLLCANLLARSGLQVLLVEQHYMVGGYCSSFRRKGFTFDAATHFYPLLGNPTTLTGALLEDLGITTEWVKMDPVDCFHFPDGSTFHVPASFDTYVHQLRREFPGESESIDRFFALVRKTHMLGLVHYFRNVSTPRIAAYQHLTVQEALNRHFENQKLKLLLAGDIGHWGSPPSKTSFVFDSMLRLAYFLGNYYPRGGSQAFVDELAQRFEDAGGHILMSSLVRRIHIRNHTACGVEVETGSPRHRVRKDISAGVVVSNADLRQTLERMVDPASIDPDYLAHIRRLRPTYPCFLMHIGLKDISLDELKQGEGHHWSSWDPEDVATHAFKVFLPTSFDQALAPPGGQILIVQKLSNVDYDKVEDWSSHKSKDENDILQSLESCIPGLLKKIVIKLSASAQTSHRYTLNHHGAMLGWEISPDQLGAQRPGIRGPFNNLYFVGHWAQPGGGITPVMISAMQAVKLITGNSLARAHTPGEADFAEIAATVSA